MKKKKTIHTPRTDSTSPLWQVPHPACTSPSTSFSIDSVPKLGELMSEWAQMEGSSVLVLPILLSAWLGGSYVAWRPDPPGPEDADAWLWCLYCCRFFQAGELRQDYLGNRQGCAFCHAAGLDIGIFDAMAFADDSSETSMWPAEGQRVAGLRCLSPLRDHPKVGTADEFDHAVRASLWAAGAAAEEIAA